MPAPAALAIPAPYNTAFTNGETALSMAEPIGSAPGNSFYNLARWMYFEGGTYQILSVADDNCTWSIGRDGISSSFKILSTALDQGAVWSEVFIPEGLFRLDLTLLNASVGTSPCYVAFSIWKGPQLVYASGNTGWWFTRNATTADALLPVAEDIRYSLPVFGIPINWKDGVLEQLEWVTDILSSESTAEQRRGVRRWARRTFEVSFLRQKRMRAMLDVFMAGIGQRRFMCPLWHEQFDLPAGLVGTTVAFPAGTLRMREFRVNDFVMVTDRCPDDFEVLRVASVNLATDVLTFVTPPNRDYPAGSVIYPMRIARVDGVPSLSNLTDAVAQARMRVIIAEAEEGPAADWGYCMPYFHFPVERAQAISLTYERQVYDADNDSSIAEITDPGELSRITSRFMVKLFGREKLFSFRSFLAAARGRAVAFYMPTHQSDIELAQDSAGGFTFKALPAGHSRFVQKRQRSRTMIAIVPNDGGPALYREVVSVDADDIDGDTGLPTSELFTVESSLPALQTELIERIMFVAPSRFDQDTFELKHETAGGTATQASLAVRATYSGKPRTSIVGLNGTSVSSYTGYPPLGAHQYEEGDVVILINYDGAGLSFDYPEFVLPVSSYTVNRSTTLLPTMPQPNVATAIVRIPSNSYDPLLPITLELLTEWHYHDDPDAESPGPIVGPTGGMVVSAKSNAAGDQFWWGVYAPEANIVEVASWNDAYMTEHTSSGIGPLAPGVRRHVALTIGPDDSTPSAYFHIDGVPISGFVADPSSVHVVRAYDEMRIIGTFPIKEARMTIGARYAFGVPFSPPSTFL